MTLLRVVLSLLLVAATSLAQTAAKPSSTKKAASGSAARKKPPAKPASKPEPPYPAIPEAPEVLQLTKPSFAMGDAWTYLVSSGNPALDGGLLVVRVQQKTDKDATFTMEAANGTSSVTVPLDAASYFAPNVTKAGTFTLKIFAEQNKAATARAGALYEAAKKSNDWENGMLTTLPIPENIQQGRYMNYNRGGGWEHNFVTGERKSYPGSALELTGPETCVVPAAALPCLRFSYQGPDNRSVSLFTPGMALAVRTSVMPQGRDWVLAELQAFEAGGTKTAGGFPDLPKAEREKALAWIRSKATPAPGKSYDPVSAFLFTIHEQVRAHAKEKILISMTPGFTNDQKGYVAEWVRWSFSVREMTPDEIAKGPAQSMWATVVPRD